MTHFACFVSNSPLKHGFLDIYLTIFFGASVYGNTSAMMATFFVRNFKNLIEILKMQEKIEKRFFVFEIVVSELFALNCLY